SEYSGVSSGPPASGAARLSSEPPATNGTVTGAGPAPPAALRPPGSLGSTAALSDARTPTVPAPFALAPPVEPAPSSSRPGPSQDLGRSRTLPAMPATSGWASG